MDIKDVLRKETILLNLVAMTKEAAIIEMAEQLVKANVVSDRDQFVEEIWKRERLSTTGIGEGVAIPHAKTNLVQTPTILFARSKQGVDYDSLDSEPAHLLFMIATPDNAADEHIKLLSKLATYLMKEQVKKDLLLAKNYQEVLSAFDIEERATTPTINENAMTILAVTGCATGIAHTYMAAEKLKEAADQLGVDIKVETNGSTGVENRLTKAEIDKAAGIIVAADIKVETDRFDGKPVVNASVADGIKNAKQLIEKILDGNARIHQPEDKANADEETQVSAGKQVYKHLLSGVSHMLPFVVGGGILIALAFLFDQIAGVPEDQLSMLGSYNDFARQLNTIGGAAFGFMLPVLAGYIAYSIADRPGLISGFAAGALASTGGAGFLGAIVGGFIAGYVILLLKSLFKGLPKSLDGIKVVLLYPVCGLLITGLLMLLVNVPLKHINTGMTDFLNNLNGTNAVMFGLLLGAMMAIDLGGPVNKAAYIFATGTLAATVTNGGSEVMAATMAAGMTPPLATSIATFLFKNKFTQAEREAGITNIVMGASFISEGAIPFAAADPLRMLPSFVVGSAVTGALVMFSGITSVAPHGGIFVIFLISKPLLYLLYITIGSVISALMIGALKKAR